MTFIYKNFLLLLFICLHFSLKGQIVNPSILEVKRFFKEIRIYNEGKSKNRDHAVPMLSGNDDSAFHKLDTIIFHYPNLPYFNCNEIKYSFRNKKKLLVSELYLCQEPPPIWTKALYYRTTKIFRRKKFIAPMYYFKRNNGKTILIVRNYNTNLKTFYEKYFINELQAKNSNNKNEKIFCMKLVRITE